MIALILLANGEDRSQFVQMYNDEIMILYIVISIYQAMKGRPILSTFFITMALGVKAGVLLILPAFLGQIQYNYGTIQLIKCIVLLFGF